MNKLIILIGLVMLCAGCVPPPNQASATTASVAPAAIVAVQTPPKAGVIDMPAVQAVPVKEVSPEVNYPKNVIARQKPLSSIEVIPGSLKDNVERIAAHYGWRQVVWDAPQDYKWVGRAKIQGENLQSILGQLLADYPLQAIFYQGNHVLYIHPRTLK